MREYEDILKKVLYWSSGDEIETIVISQNFKLTRFTKNRIHQNVKEKDAVLRIRVIKDGKQGVSSTNILEDVAIKKAIDNALHQASFAKEDPFLSLPHPSSIPKLDLFYKETESATPERIAYDIGKIIEIGERANCLAHGAYSVGTTKILIANSNALFCDASFTSCSLVVIMEKDGATGYSSGISRDINKLDIEGLAQIALEKACMGKNPKEIEEGEYEVILEEPAVSDMIFFLGYLGLGALSYQEQRSFACGKMGQKIMGDNITIWDDGLDLAGMCMPFDFEGTPKQKVTLIENGVCKALVYDSYTANKEGKTSTGHSLFQPNTLGPIPLNLFMKGGEPTKDEMIKNTKKGILVTRFHYTNIVEPISTTITGMTRDGTFFIENGKIVYPIKNMRFTQSIIDAFSCVSMLSSERKLAHEGMIMEVGGGSYVPAIKIDKFNFTGKTEF
ncbi:TPA: TldD/PmbA family protein [bacterium]|nr:TldD/PmbA family protein [bacterium]